jgi:excinuclease ABC subunit A
LIDQKPIGRSARSNPVSYLKVYDEVRKIMASTHDAKARSLTPGHFSLNVEGGRCPICKGEGYETIDMAFMDDIRLICDECGGKKFQREILQVRYQGKNINEILSLTVREAMDFFVKHPKIRRPLSLLREVGLEYLQLGQPAQTLSGGESQRLKIARELNMTSQNGTLYILDEPTVGLHFREVELLVGVLNKLIDGGASVVIIEHNLDVIKEADFLIEMGPGGGEDGGEIVFSGTPEQMSRKKNCATAPYLKPYFSASKSRNRERPART